MYAFSVSGFGLTSVTIPSSVTSIGEGAFRHCLGLISIIIPSSVTSIEERAFSACSSLINISVDSKNPAYTSVDGVLFDKDMHTLIQYPPAKIGETYIIPSSVTVIMATAFEDCSSLTDITIPSSVTSIGLWAFANCISLTSIALPPSVTSIGELTFAGCISLTSVTMPPLVTSIGLWAFASCISLTSITIPSSVILIGEKAFSACTRLTNISVDNGNSAYTSVDGVLFDKNIHTLIQYPLAKIGEIYIIPLSVISIEVGAFARSNLTDVTIPPSVTSIGKEAFAWSPLTSITIPSLVTFIEDIAFVGCTRLINITVANENPAYTSVDGVLFDKNIYTLIQYPPAKIGSTYTVPLSVTSIRENAFAFSNLKSVTLSREISLHSGIVGLPPIIPSHTKIIYSD